MTLLLFAERKVQNRRGERKKRSGKQEVTLLSLRFL